MRPTQPRPTYGLPPEPKPAGRPWTPTTTLPSLSGSPGSSKLPSRPGTRERLEPLAGSPLPARRGPSREQQPTVQHEPDLPLPPQQTSPPAPATRNQQLLGPLVTTLQPPSGPPPRTAGADRPQSKSQPNLPIRQPHHLHSRPLARPHRHRLLLLHRTSRPSRIHP